jgi:hypothetical protein
MKLIKQRGIVSIVIRHVDNKSNLNRKETKKKEDMTVVM